MFSTRSRVLAIAGGAAACLLAITAGVSASSSAGQPQPAAYLLCGTFTPAADMFSGSSTVDHPSGASATGSATPIDPSNVPTGDACDNSSSSSDTFQWTIEHSNVQTSQTNPRSEAGTEHGLATISTISSTYSVGFNGQITNFDLSTADNAGDACQDDSRVIYYASGHASFSNCATDTVGNANTHGGAQLGQHFVGQYGTIVWQESDNDTDGSNCPSGGGTYCFEAILVGQQN